MVSYRIMKTPNSVISVDWHETISYEPDPKIGHDLPAGGSWVPLSADSNNYVYSYPNQDLYVNAKRVVDELFSQIQTDELYMALQETAGMPQVGNKRGEDFVFSEVIESSLECTPYSRQYCLQ